MIEQNNRFSSLQIQDLNIDLSKHVNKTRAQIEPRFFKCKIGTLNCRTASDDIKLALILREFDKAGCLICCLQEVRLVGTGTKRLVVEGKSWVISWSGADTKMHGVAICYVESNHLKIDQQPEQISPRLIALNMDVAGTKLRLVSAYAPTNTYSMAQKEVFYAELIDLAKIKSKTKRKLAVFGDFNGFCSAFDSDCRFSGEICDLGEYQSTESGDQFLEFCSNMKLSTLASFFKHRFLHRATFYSNDQRTIRVYDHCLTHDWIRRYTTDCRVRNGVRADSDHRAVIASFAFPCYKRDKKLTKKRKNSKKSKKLDVKLLRVDDVVNKKFMDELEGRLSTNSEQDMKSLTDILKESAQCSIPTVAARKLVHPWDHDVELRGLVQKRDNIHRRNKAEYKKATSEIRKRSKFLKNEFYKSEANKINLAWFNRDIEKTYALAKDHKMGADISIGKKCDPNLLKSHVRNHLNKENTLEPPPEITTSIPYSLKTNLYIPFDDSELTADQPTRAELIEAITNLKNNKASTDLAAECLKAAIKSEHFVDCLHESIVSVWNNKLIPENWRYSRVTCLFKKGDPELPENYRTLSVSAVVLKAVMSLVLVRARGWYESLLSDGQNGFREARGTADSVFVVDNLRRMAKSENKSIYGLALDLRAAYDWIIRNWVFLSIAARTADSEYEDEVKGLFELVRLLYSETYSYMAGESEKDAFPTSCGLLQGGVESPPLFAIFCDTIMRLFVEKLEELGIGGVRYRFFIPASASTRSQRVMNKLSGTTVCYYTAYCDDFFIMAESINELQIMTDELEKLFTRFGLTICQKKTKTLIFNYLGDIKNYPKTILKILGNNIDNVKVFKYLGVKLDVEQHGTGETEIKNRINLANNKFRELKHMFENTSIRIGIRVLFYHAFVRSRMCYLCGLWSTTAKLRKKVENCHRRHLRSMIGGGWKRRGGPRNQMDEIGYDFKWVYNTNQVYKLCRTDSVLNFVDSQRASWIAHCVRTDNDRMIKTTMFDESQNTRRGYTVSVLDQLLSETRNYDMEDSEVYKACILRNLFCELDNRGVVFAEKHFKIE